MAATMIEMDDGARLSCEVIIIPDAGHVGRRTRAAEDLERGLAHLGDERVDVHERLHVTAGRAGVGDDHAAVGVTDQDDGTVVRWARNDAT